MGANRGLSWEIELFRRRIDRGCRLDGGLENLQYNTNTKTKKEKEKRKKEGRKNRKKEKKKKEKGKGREKGGKKARKKG